ncbi:hypothetical protein EJ04DRAFT_566988 [Polyplosphaeria fusca]|uniref:Uncharacterized protein n=1 Tax=Polyplosphaeria fusca TaxID=682080 RepID=A0A9P4QUM4_9PLEO|nr:hypothetical protein EJ04DRAFT_566988 [Polyplosphaeria fusca]
MGQLRTGTKHHCPGKNCWISDISPGGCRPVKEAGIKNAYCSKHEQKCPNGCASWICLKNQSGCGNCVREEEMESKREREAAQTTRDAANQAQDTFWNPGKERKKPRK